MKTYTAHTLLSIALLSFSTLSLADPLSFNNPFSTGSSSSGVANTGNIYLGGSLTNTSSDDYCASAANCDDSDMGWKLLAGYTSSEFISYEIGYHALGQMTSSTNQSEVSGISANAVAKLAINDQIELFGKGGVFKWKSKNTVGNRNSLDLMFGAGANYKLNENLAIRGEWERMTDIESSSTEMSDIDVISAGFTYKTM